MMMCIEVMMLLSRFSRLLKMVVFLLSSMSVVVDLGGI